MTRTLFGFQELVEEAIKEVQLGEIDRDYGVVYIVHAHDEIVQELKTRLQGLQRENSELKRRLEL